MGLSARAVFDCSLRSRGSRWEAAAFLSHSQTKKRVCSFVRPGQRRAILGAVESAISDARRLTNTAGFRASWRLLGLVG
jgi:hypothetical protein